MEKMVIIVSAVVGSLGVLSAILSFSAEGTKLTPFDIRVYGRECIYPQNPALGLAVCAALFLLVAQVMISAVGGCCGCCKSRAVPSETKRIIGIVCAVVSWVAAGAAWVLLLDGASWNANTVRDTAPYCKYVKDGVFSGAAMLALAATALGVTSYIMLRSQPAASTTTTTTEAPSKPHEPAAIPTGQPQLPPPPHSPQQAPSNPPPTAPPEQAPSSMDHPQSSPAAAADAPSTSGGQPPYAGAMTGHQLPDQAYALQQQPTPDYSVQSQGSEQSNPQTGISTDDLLNLGIKVGVKVLEEVVKQSLSPGNTDPTAMAGGILLSMVAGASGSDVGATDWSST